MKYIIVYYLILSCFMLCYIISHYTTLLRVVTGMSLRLQAAAIIEDLAWTDPAQLLLLPVSARTARRTRDELRVEFTLPPSHWAVSKNWEVHVFMCFIVKALLL